MLSVEEIVSPEKAILISLLKEYEISFLLKLPVFTKNSLFLVINAQKSRSLFFCKSSKTAFLEDLSLIILLRLF